MIKLYKGQTKSLYDIQKDLNLNINRLYRYATGEYSIDKMPIDLVLKLSNYFKIEANTLYEKMKEYEKERNIQKLNKLSIKKSNSIAKRK